MVRINGLISELMEHKEPDEPDVYPVTGRVYREDVRALDWLVQQLGAKSRSALAGDLLQAAIADATEAYLNRFEKEQASELLDSLEAAKKRKGDL